MWTARSTLALFGFLALSSQLPAIIDIYSFVLWRLLFLPSYLVMLFLYDGPWGLENVVYAFDAVVASERARALLWDGGLFVTYYLFAVATTWLGRRVTRASRSSDGT